MGNLRLQTVKVFDSTTIRARFDQDLDPLLNTANVEISANLPGVPAPIVEIVEVKTSVITITTRPLTPYAPYYLTFKSTELFPFRSKDAQSFLSEDGKTNIALILGFEDPSDPIRDVLLGYLQKNVYNLDNGTVVRDIVNSQSNVISRALYDIKQAKNDNYLGYTVEDERKVRGAGPYDRLSEEGAYQIIRVGKKLSSSTVSTSYDFESFPAGPITLQAVSVANERLEAGEGAGTFNGLTLTADNRFVTRLTGVRVAYQDGDSAVYDLETFGYQILSFRYDQDFASPLLTLSDNQFRLSETALEEGFRLPGAGDDVFIDYEYKQTGRVIDADSVAVSQVLTATREVVAPLLNKFSLLHAPIVSTNDVIPTSDGIDFLDPQAYPPFSSAHPAFLRELPFRLDATPSRVGEYMVNYETGEVFCYGAETNDGTGDFPPVATYTYRKTFVPDLDYTYDSDFSELVASPLRDLEGEEATISLDFELVLVPEIDYVAQIHTEALNERIENRLRSLNSLQVENSPVTNVFRIFNETTGEIYPVQRWNDSTVYFTFNHAPNITEQLKETIKFVPVTNELLLVSEELEINSLRVFKINLENSRIGGETEDCLGSSFNSSLAFSSSDIFLSELYYDGQTLTTSENLDRLGQVGQYLVDYLGGTIWVVISNSQTFDLGTVSYKKTSIFPDFSHVTSVGQIYRIISNLSGIVKRYDYVSFGEGFITPSTIELSDERFTDGDETLPYVVDSGLITVTDDIRLIRHIYDHYDLINNETPVDFTDGAEFLNNVITLQSTGVTQQETLAIESGIEVTVSYVSPGVQIVGVSSVIRVSDGQELWAGDEGSFSDYTIFLNNGNVNDIVLVTYQLALNGSATPIVDYDRGEFLVDYNYLADEILISYEYGDNCLDFRSSSALNEGEEYFVTYKVGALRQGLLQNFGSLVDLPILNNLDTDFPRERYRDALRAALQSFPLGPTIPAIKGIVSNITHIEPELTEAAFQIWSLGVSRLYSNKIKTTGPLELMVGKYDYGVLVDDSEDTIRFPISDNVRLEEGTLETWVIPEWDGLDNDATLTFSLKLDGYDLSADRIWIGADSHHPELDEENQFTLNRKDASSPIGLPSKIYTETGAFIFYDEDNKFWKLYAKESVLADGYVFSGTITSSGEVYHVDFIPGLKEVNDVLRSGLNSIYFEFRIDGYDLLEPDGYQDGYDLVDGYSPADGYVANYSFDGINFMADDQHYLFDFGKTKDQSRFSIFKDGSGYLNFQVFDKGQNKRRTKYTVSSNISDWKAGEKHHLATSWRINSADRRDELHLFIDGEEVPNIMRYGGRPKGLSSDTLRTVKPEIIGTIPKNIVIGSDLETQIGSSIVSSASKNFTSLGILAGDEIVIREDGFGTYTILSVSNNQLTLNSTMPASLDDARFSVNEYSVIVSSLVNISSNITVSILHDGEEIEVPGLRADDPYYSVSTNALNQNVLTLLGGAEAGDEIVIRTLGLNHRRARARQYVWGDTSSVIKTQLPPPINLDAVSVIAILLPLVKVGPTTATFDGTQFTGIFSPSQPTNQTEGRYLKVKISGSNVRFSDTVAVTIQGNTTEVLTFTAEGSQTTTNKFSSLTSITVVATPINSSRDAVTIEVSELDSMLVSEGNETYPILRYSFKVQSGTDLTGTIGSGTVADPNSFFVASTVGQKLVINTPPSVAGTYTITERTGETVIVVDPVLPASFAGGTWDIYDVSLGRSGFQNGYFTFEQAGSTNVAYPLPQGTYEFDYPVYLEVPFDPVSKMDGYIGSDFQGAHQAKAVIDEFRILSKQLTDVRVGETLASGQDSITTDANKLKEFSPNSSTLMLLHFNSKPFQNEADYWVSNNGGFIQSGESVNSEFSESIVFTHKPLIVDNAGLLTTTREGSIEFWVSPRFDTFNDPVPRYYFDASGSIVEETTSLTSGTVKVKNRIGEILSVRLINDLGTGTDYFKGGSIASDFQTINLHSPLPYQQTPVKVDYLPSGLKGNRLSILKDSAGFITFNVDSGDGLEYSVSQPVFWSRDSWHRVMATYKFNQPNHKGEIRLFVDGEEKRVLYFGEDVFWGDGFIFGQGSGQIANTILTADITFTDPVNHFFIGSDYLQTHPAEARIDNLRLSNTARRPVTIAGQPIDVNYNSNNSLALPVVPDVYTTYLLDFDKLVKKEDDFTICRSSNFGLFDFDLQVIDSFGIVKESAKVKQTLETLIKTLKPAVSRVAIKYVY